MFQRVMSTSNRAEIELTETTKTASINLTTSNSLIFKADSVYILKSIATTRSVGVAIVPYYTAYIDDVAIISDIEIPNKSGYKTEIQYIMKKGQSLYLKLSSGSEAPISVIVSAIKVEAS